MTDHCRALVERIVAEAKPAATPDLWWAWDGALFNDALMERLRDALSEPIAVRGQPRPLREFAP